MEYDEVWGIAADRIRDFFLSQSDVIHDGENFVCGNARITVEPLPDNTMLPWRLPRSRVCICGGSDAEPIHKRFFMRFLSAGG